MALKDDIIQLEKYLKSFVNIKDIQDLKNLVLPKLKETQDLLQGYRFDNVDMLQCIREFDEKLCLKVNKLSLDKVEKEARETYYTKADQRKFNIEYNMQTEKRNQETLELRKEMEEFQS